MSLKQTKQDIQRMQINQAIEKRAGLRFRYAPYGEVPVETIRWLPFTENPTISESRKANYASKKIFLRNEPVRLYTGSEARKFKVEFHYTLIHLASMIPTKELLRIFGKDPEFHMEFTELSRYLDYILSRDLSQKSFHTPNLQKPEAPAYTLQGLSELKSYTKTFVDLRNELSDRLSDGSEGPFGPVPGNPESIFNAFLVHLMRTGKKWKYISSLLQYAINHVRNTVISTHQTPVKGPPIVELKWGAMYDFVPCVVTDYQITTEENAGYDTKSLYPQRLKISLSMEEMRAVHGNLHGDPKVSGVLPGWDNILSFTTHPDDRSYIFPTHDGTNTKESLIPISTRNL
jgi:hypothetical protein